MEKTLISVIVPIYNRQNVLSRTIESLTQQEYNNLEIILVDDGSTDESLILCNEYARQDDRIKVFTKKNGGVSSARNYGLSKASGEYVSFIDAGDYVKPNLYSDLAAYFGMDLINFFYFITRGNGVENEVHTNFGPIKKFDRAFVTDTILPCFLNLKENEHQMSLCFSVLNLYKKSIIDKYLLRYDESLKKWEDKKFLIYYIDHCNNGVFVNKCYYVYDCDPNHSHLSSLYYPEIISETVKNLSEREMYFAGRYTFDTDYFYRYTANIFLNLFIEVVTHETNEDAYEFISKNLDSPLLIKVFSKYSPPDNRTKKIKNLINTHNVYRLINELKKYNSAKNKVSLKSKIICKLSAIKHKLKNK